MLQYSESRFRHIDSDENTMRSDLSAFLLEHCAADDVDMYKRTTYAGNVMRERYTVDDDHAEFIVETEFYYGRTKLTWWATSTDTKKHCEY